MSSLRCLVMSCSDVKCGSYVKSLAGRDKGRINVVVRLDSVESEYVYIADGLCRRIEKPKKKKLKHLALLNYQVYDGILNNKKIAQSVRMLSSEAGECKIQSE